jgi:hypothetical protein
MGRKNCDSKCIGFKNEQCCEIWMTVCSVTAVARATEVKRDLCTESVIKNMLKEDDHIMGQYSKMATNTVFNEYEL